MTKDGDFAAMRVAPAGAPPPPPRAAPPLLKLPGFDPEKTGPAGIGLVVRNAGGVPFDEAVPFEDGVWNAGGFGPSPADPPKGFEFADGGVAPPNGFPTGAGARAGVCIAAKGSTGPFCAADGASAKMSSPRKGSTGAARWAGGAATAPRKREKVREHGSN